MPKRLYYCMLWRNLDEEPATKFMYADSVKELVEEFLYFGFVSVSITDITDVGVDYFDL